MELSASLKATATDKVAQDCMSSSTLGIIRALNTNLISAAPVASGQHPQFGEDCAFPQSP